MGAHGQGAVVASTLGHPLAVLDVETTGFVPDRDRIVEVAVVRLDVDGKPTTEYATLVNPERDVGATEIHGISDADVAHAPRFAEIVGDLFDVLRNAVIVGHNLSFDYRFLSAEVERAGYNLPRLPLLCTLALSKWLQVRAPRHRLSTLCDEAGIDLDEGHAALVDARATAQLALHYLGKVTASGLDLFERIGFDGDLLSVNWPSCQGCGRVVARAMAPPSEAASYIRQLIRRLETPPDTELGVAAYYEVLDRALADRELSDAEAESLYHVARLWTLTAPDVRRAHRRYLRSLVDTAVSDGHLSSDEQADIKNVSRLLGIGADSLEDIMAEAMGAQATAVQLGASVAAATNPSLAGKSVCFTGALQGTVRGERVTRVMAHALASGAGLVVRETVVRGLDILVVADPTTTSSKARKAREMGIRIVGETEFWVMLGVVSS